MIAAAPRTCAALVAMLALGAVSVPASPPPLDVKPARILLVSGTQIQDPVVVDAGGDLERMDAVAIAALLKLWGIPFDVLRLDVHTMILADVVDASGTPRYGAILWAARQDAYPWQPQNYAVLAEAVAERGVSLIAVGNRIRETTISRLLGITYAATTGVCDRIVVNDAAHSHFVIRGMEGAVARHDVRLGGAAVSAVDGGGVTPLAFACDVPQLTVRTVDAARRTRAVWIGGDASSFAFDPTFIEILRRALVFAVGYAVYKEYRHAVMLRMDDPGCAPSAYLKCTPYRWDYPQLSQSDWRTKVIEPLRRYHARLGVLFCAGYPDPDRTHPPNSVVPSCSVDVPNWALDCGHGPEPNPQAIASTCAGLHDGVTSGLIEIHSHGYTHMRPDLTEWRSGTATSGWSRFEWYREFHDDVHNAEIDPAVQRDRLARSSAGIAAEFGREPLMFGPGGSSISGRKPPRGAASDAPTLVLTVRGARARARYTVHFGGSPHWRRIGSFTTDVDGNGSAEVHVPSHLGRSGTTGRYFALKRGATQLIAGPAIMPLDTHSALAFRSREQMTAAERTRFAFAIDPLAAGSIGGASIFVAVSGAAAERTYTVRYGDTALGTLRTDLDGDGHALFGLPRQLVGGAAGGYFTLERDGVQYIAGPTATPLDLAITLPWRDRRRMTMAEQARFAPAADATIAGAVSTSALLPRSVAETYTYMIAADARFAFAHDDTGHYLGRDYVITLPQVSWVGADVGALQAHFDRGVPGIIIHHDADVSLDPEFYPRMLERIHTRWPDVSYITPDELSAYLHAVIRTTRPTPNSVGFEFAYDPHYARYFAQHVSDWTLHLSDELLADIRAQGRIDIVTDGTPTTVDAARYFGEKRHLSIPPALGTHTLLLRRHRQ